MFISRKREEGGIRKETTFREEPRKRDTSGWAQAICRENSSRKGET